MQAWTSWAPCTLCGCRDLRPLWTAARSGRQVVRCWRCRLIFYNPQPSAAQLRDLYCAGYFEDEFPARAAGEQIEVAYRRLARIERDAARGRLLDVGCGVGRFAATAAARGWDVLGIDTAEAAVRAARALSIPVIHGSLADVDPTGHQPFDVVTMWDVLEHVADPVGDLRRARVWLRPGGLLVVQSPNGNGVPFACLGRRWEQFVEAHLYYFAPATLHRALVETGFDRITIEGSEVFLGGSAADACTRQSRTWSVVERVRRLRDRVLVAAGYDDFNIMVVTAHRPPAERRTA